MIQIEFVHYSETKTGSSYHTVSGLKSVKVDPQSVKGIDYHSMESRKARFSFYAESWVVTNFIDGFSFITDTKYNIYAIRLKNGDTTDYIGYVKPDNVKYDVKTGMVDISATDILGVLLELSDESKIYEKGQNVISTLLTSEVEDIVDAFDVSVTDNTDNITYNLNERVIYPHEEEFFPIAGQNGLYQTGGSTGGYTGTIRNVTSNGLVAEIRMCDYRTYYASSGVVYESIVSLFFILTKSFEIYDVRFNKETTYYSGSYENRLFVAWATSYYGTGISNSYVVIPNVPYGNITIRFKSTNNYPDYIMTNVYFEGYMQLENIYIDKDDDNDYVDINRKDLMKTLLLLLNAGLRIEKDGDIIIEEKSLIGTGTDIDAYTLENKKGFILHSDANISFGYMKNFETYERVLTNYYNNLFETFKYEYNLSVRSDITLSLGDNIKSDGKYLRIVEIDEPYNQNIYYIKAWGE